MSMTLEKALASLDPTNADLWTSDGSPKMDVLQGLTGDMTLTRAKVRQAAPAFSRENPTLDLGDEPPAPSGPTDQGTDASPIPQDEPDADDEPELEEELQAEESEDETALDAEINALSEEIAAREQELNEGRKAMDELIVRKDRLIAERAVHQTPHSDTIERMRFINRQAAMRAERAGNAQAARELLKQAQIPGGLPIDVALATRPRQRPQGVTSGPEHG